MRKTLGIASKITTELVKNERQLLLRLASIVQWKDPDTLLSWDTQGGGLGYIIERGVFLTKNDDDDKRLESSSSSAIDMVRLLGRTPRVIPQPSSSSQLQNGSSSFSVFGNPIGANQSETNDTHNKSIKNQGGSNDDNSKQQQTNNYTWSGSGLGAEWDERVGAGAAAASIILSEEVKHPNASYQPAMVAMVLNKRIPYHDDILLTRWYGGEGGRERHRVLRHRLSQAMANLLLFDALD
eukprot:3570481-Ditylum_brightwellii.AAC.1